MFVKPDTAVMNRLMENSFAFRTWFEQRTVNKAGSRTRNNEGKTEYRITAH